MDEIEARIRAMVDMLGFLEAPPTSKQRQGVKRNLVFFGSFPPILNKLHSVQARWEWEGFIF